MPRDASDALGAVTCEYRFVAREHTWVEHGRFQQKFGILREANY